MLGERKSSMCRSRVARGHFTLMADGPIEMTAALHDLKVRRQRIIFQWWRRGIGGVKWCLSTTTTTTPPPPPPPLLNYCRTAKMESTQHRTPTSLHLHRAQHETNPIAPVFPALIHHNEKFCSGKNSGSRFAKPNRAANHPAHALYLNSFHYVTKLYLRSLVAPLRNYICASDKVKSKL